MDDKFLSYFIIVAAVLGLAAVGLNQSADGEHLTFGQLLESAGFYRSDPQKESIVKNVRKGENEFKQYSESLQEHQRLVMEENKEKRKSFIEDLTSKIKQFQSRNSDAADSSLIREKQRTIAQSVEDQRRKTKEASELQKERQRQINDQTEAQQSMLREKMRDQR